MPIPSRVRRIAPAASILLRGLARGQGRFANRPSFLAILIALGTVAALGVAWFGPSVSQRDQAEQATADPSSLGLMRVGRAAKVRVAAGFGGPAVIELGPGHLVMVLGNDTQGSLTLYRIQYSRDLERVAFGWIADGPDGLRGLEPARPSACAERPNVLYLIYQTPIERLLCYRGRPLDLAYGTFDRAVIAPPAGDTDLDWLGGGRTASLWGDLGVGSEGGPLSVRITPGLGDLQGGRWLRIVGHFDDPVSAGCARAGGVGEDGWLADDRVLWCREQFVVTAAWPTGSPAPPSDADGP